MQFMASIALDLGRRAEIEHRLPAEQAAVRTLQQQGVLDALYVPSGGAPSRLWAVLNGDSEAAVRQALESLPLYPYMQIDLTPLRPLEARA